MSAVLLGLGYLALAAVGAVCWGFVFAESRRRPGRLVGWLVAGALATLAARVLVTWILGQHDLSFAQEKAMLGLPLSAVASILAAALWWMPRRDGSPGRRGALTAGAVAAAVAASLVEIALTAVVGAPIGAAAVVSAGVVVAGTGVVTALVRAAPTGRTRRPAFVAGAATAAIVIGVGVVGFVESSGAGALQADGFGPAAAHGHEVQVADAATANGRPVTELTQSPSDSDRAGDIIEVALEAQQQRIDLPSGASIDAWTFGSLAGPAIVATVGDTLSVRMTNIDVDAGATVHWHGYPVANAFDGVAGVTQDAVRPGDEFDADLPMTQPGTYWYHTHQRGSEGVVRGLYGTLVVQPETGQADDVDLTLPVHTFAGHTVIGTSDVVEERVITPGDSVRLRLINTDQTPQTFVVDGAPFRVVALDGMDVATDPLRNRSLVVAAGGRVDVVLDMPASPVRVGVAGDRRAGVGLVPEEGVHVPALVVPATAFDPLADLVAHPSSATPAQARAAAAIDQAVGGADFDVERTLVLDRLPRIVGGLPAYAYTVDGRVYPYIEPTVVDLGDTVRVRLVNRSFETHPMHPHGHAVLVLAVDGVKPVQPLWLDTFDVGPGEVWEVALYADNPGIWMDHCHNLEHAALGMVTHLAYRGIVSPFEHGGPSDNAPE